MAQRVLAVLGAIGLVLAAIAVRNVIDDDNTDDPKDNDEVNVVCAVEPACHELTGPTIGIARPQSVLDDLEAGNPDDLDVWVTTSSWLEVLQERAPETIAEVRSLATSPVIVAALPQRAPAIESLCSGEPLLGCLATASRTPWADLGQPDVRGVLNVGLTDPERDLGLPVLAAAAAGYFDRLDFVSNDFDGGFRSALGNLTELTSGDATVRVMVTASGSYTAVGSILAPARTEAGQREIVELEPDPSVAATVVAIRFTGDTEFPDLRPVTNALVEEGWDAVDDGDAPPPTLKPGVMAALLTLWTEVR